MILCAPFVTFAQRNTFSLLLSTSSVTCIGVKPRSRGRQTIQQGALVQNVALLESHSVPLAVKDLITYSSFILFSEKNTGP